MNRPPDYIHTSWNQSFHKVLHFINDKTALEFSKKCDLQPLYEKHMRLRDSLIHPALEDLNSENYQYNTIELHKSHFNIKEYNYPTNNMIPKERKNKKIIRIITAYITQLIKDSMLFYNVGTCETLAEKFAEQLYSAGVTAKDWASWNEYMENHGHNIIKISCIKKYQTLATEEEIAWCKATIGFYTEEELLLTDGMLLCPFFYDCYYRSLHPGKELLDIFDSSGTEGRNEIILFLYREVKLYKYLTLCIDFFEQMGYIFPNSLGTFWASFVDTVLCTGVAHQYFSEGDIFKIMQYLSMPKYINAMPLGDCDGEVTNALINDCIYESIRETCVQVPEPVDGNKALDELDHRANPCDQLESGEKYRLLPSTEGAVLSSSLFRSPAEDYQLDGSQSDDDDLYIYPVVVGQVESFQTEDHLDKPSNESNELDQSAENEEKLYQVSNEEEPITLQIEENCDEISLCQRLITKKSNVTPDSAKLARIQDPPCVVEASTSHDTIVKSEGTHHFSTYSYLIEWAQPYIRSGLLALTGLASVGYTGDEVAAEQTKKKIPRKRKQRKATDRKSELSYFERLYHFFRHSLQNILTLVQGLFSYIARLIGWQKSTAIADMWLAHHEKCLGSLKKALEIRRNLVFENHFNDAFLCDVEERHFEPEVIKELLVVESPVEERPYYEVTTLKESDVQKPAVLGMEDAITGYSDGLTNCNVVFDKDGNFHLEEKPEEMSYASKMAHVTETCEQTKVWQNDPINSTDLEDDPNLRRYYWQRYRLFINFDYGICLDKESWYSVTPEVLAAHQAKRCASDVIIDGFCGAGGNAIQLAKTCKKVIAIDLDPDKIEIARCNAQIYEVAHKIKFMVGDYFDLVPRLKADAVYLSPPWGGVKYTAGLAKSAMYNVKWLNGEIDGQRMFEVARKISPNVAIYLPKCSNVFQLIEMAGPCGSVDLEYAHFNGCTKSLTAYYGNLAKTRDTLAR